MATFLQFRNSSIRRLCTISKVVLALYWRPTLPLINAQTSSIGWKSEWYGGVKRIWCPCSSSRRTVFAGSLLFIHSRTFNRSITAESPASHATPSSVKYCCSSAFFIVHLVLFTRWYAALSSIISDGRWRFGSNLWRRVCKWCPSQGVVSLPCFLSVLSFDWSVDEFPAFQGSPSLSLRTD